MKLLVLGAGQLAQMMYLAAAPIGVEVFAVDVKDNSVVNPINKIAYDFDLDAAIADVNAITVEFEHIPEDLLTKVAESGKLYPSVAAILAGADRVREKHLLSTHQVANCAHEIISSLSQLDGIESRLGSKLVFKSSRDGYDGYGQWRMKSEDDLPALLEQFSHIDLESIPIVVEKFAPFDREISIIGARDQNGTVSTFEIAENLHFEGQLHVSVSPATGLTEHIKRQAEDIFERIAEGLSYVGVLAIELFQIGDTLLVNEIAPRVHNSGHWTQKGADTCQFEQHVRAVLGFPLGSTESKGVTAMVNIIGCTRFSRDLISIPGCHLHWYGKKLRKKRKMGHINVTANDYVSLGNKLSALLAYLPKESFPLLEDESIRLINIKQ